MRRDRVGSIARPIRELLREAVAVRRRLEPPVHRGAVFGRRYRQKWARIAGAAHAHRFPQGKPRYVTTN